MQHVNITFNKKRYMAIRYRLIRNGIKGDTNYGRYYAHTVRNTEVSLGEIEREIESNCTAKASDVRLVVKEFYETIRRAMQDGHVVNMGELGKMYITVTSRPSASPEEFSTKGNITGFRCRYVPCGRRRGTGAGDMARTVRRFMTDGCRAVKAV